MLRAIVFDFDGVLADSEPLHYRAYHGVLLDEGVELTKTDYYANYLGYDDAGAFGAVSSDRRLGWTTDDIARLVVRKADVMQTFEHDDSVLFPGARAAIERTAAVMPIAIASGALGSEIRRVLDSAKLTPYFTAIVAAEDTVASKPAPDPYLRAVALLSSALGPLAARDCAAIEDSRWGLESARAAGLHTVAVAHTYDARELGAADLIIPTLLAFDLETLERRFAG